MPRTPRTTNSTRTKAPAPRGSAKSTRAKPSRANASRANASSGQRRSTRGRWGWLAVKWGAVAAIWLGVVSAGVVAWYLADLPDVDDALSAARRPSVTVKAADGSILGTSGDVYGATLRVADMPPALPLAVLATEDRRFYDHFGLDVFGLVRAMVANARAGAVVQGGSTITQQAAKNLFLSPERTIKRKVQELALALWLEHEFTKEQILAIYLNRAYFGAGAYGVDAAARKFFGRPATEVSTYQAAMLAGLLKAPSRYNPIASPENAAERTTQVLGRMVDAGYITRDEAGAAELQPGTVVADVGDRHGGRYFVDWVVAQVSDFVATQDRDVVVATTLDPNLQNVAEAKTREILDGPGAKKDVSQAAIVAMNLDGAIRAMVGGRTYTRSSFNRAVQAYRQSGSAFKPLVYLAGLESGLLPDSRLMDSPVEVNGWRPQNFTERYRGEVTLREALSDSINTVSVRVSEHAGRRKVMDAARRFGITTDIQPIPSLALGAVDVSLIELTSVYAVFANGGMGVWPYGIDTIHDSDGRLLYSRSGSGPGRVASPGHTSALTSMLVDVVEHGTGRAARLPRPVAGKTGTSQNYRDAWFVGFTADLVTGVWMGNDDGRPMKRVTGGSLPAQLWQSFMYQAHAGLPAKPLPSLIREAPPASRVIAASRPGGEPETRARPASVDSPGFWNRLMSAFNDDKGNVNGDANGFNRRREDP